LQRLDSVLPIENLRNVGLGQQGADPISNMRAHPSFALLPSSPSAVRRRSLPKPRHGLPLPSRQAPLKNPKRSSESPSEIAQQKRKKRKTLSSNKRRERTSPSHARRQSDGLGSSFPLPALEESEIRKIQPRLNSYREFWSGINSKEMRREVFLRRLRLGTISLRRSSSIKAATTPPSGDDTGSSG
jgi:hypothetical protein